MKKVFLTYTSKKFIFVFVCLTLFIALDKPAYCLNCTYTFSGQAAGGIASAVMTVDFPDSVGPFYPEILNTSPITLIDKSGPNTPGITRYGFISNYERLFSGWLDWSVQGAVGTSDQIVFDRHPIGLEADLYLWDHFYEINQSEYVTGYEVGSWISSTDAINGAFFNPEVLGKDNNLPTGVYLNANMPTYSGLDYSIPYYFFSPIASSTFYFEPGKDFESFDFSSVIPFVFMENVGADGTGELMLLGTTQVSPVPEPATMLLFCTGLVGLVANRRKLIKK